MHIPSLLRLGGGLLLAATLTAASPHPIVEATTRKLFTRQVQLVPSPDNTCGNVFGGAGNGYTCGPENVGSCCSQYGYCGATQDYCGTGCQGDFGTCNGDPDEPPVEDPFLCGPQNNNWRCSGEQCCNVGGFCGNTTDYCAEPGCQAAYGVCEGGEEPEPGAGRCGQQFSDRKCSSSECCSPAGYCGVGRDYCSAPDCQVGFGKCDSDITPAGDSTANIPRPVLGNVPYGADIYDCAGNPGQIALTYDDGPYIYTEALLDTLKAYNFKATFFVTGINNGKGAIDSSTTDWPSLLRRMITDGHQIASHTWSHRDLSTLSTTDQDLEMVKNEMALRNVIGKFPTYMRPPYSSCNAQCLSTMRRLGYHVTYFDMDTEDYIHNTPQTNQRAKDIVHEYLTDLSPSNADYLSIAHDIHEQTVHNLTIYMFDEMVRLGWKGVTAGACLNDPEANWYRGSNTPSPSPTTTSVPTTSTTSRPTTTATPTISTTRASTTSSTATPTPTSSCSTYRVGNFCARPMNAFTTRLGCLQAQIACSTDYTRCTNVSGNTAATCRPFQTAWCDRIGTFCSSCPLVLGSCNSSGLVLPRAP